MKMTRILLVAVSIPLLAGCIVVHDRRPPPPPAYAPPGGEVVVEEAPPQMPPPQMEVVPIAPGPIDVWFWVPGCWEWRGHYVWIGGHWAPRPHPGAVWVRGEWTHRGHRAVWVPGHWR